MKVHVHKLGLAIIISKLQGRHLFLERKYEITNNKALQTAITFRKQWDN